MKQNWRKKEKWTEKHNNEPNCTVCRRVLQHNRYECKHTARESIICDFNWNRFHVRAKKSVMQCLFTQQHKIMTKDKQRYTLTPRSVTPFSQSHRCQFQFSLQSPPIYMLEMLNLPFSNWIFSPIFVPLNPSWHLTASMPTVHTLYYIQSFINLTIFICKIPFLPYKNEY